EREPDQRPDEPEGRKELAERHEHVTRRLALGRAPAGLGEERVGQLVLVLTFEREADRAAEQRVLDGRGRGLERPYTLQAIDAGEPLEGLDERRPVELVVLERQPEVAPRAREAVAGERDPGDAEGAAHRHE